MNTEQRQSVVAVARTWLRTPYHPGQRLKGVGVDCIQFLIGVYAEAELTEPVDTGYYSPDWHLHRSEERYVEGLSRYMVRTTEPQFGDVALFRFGRTVSHGGILLQNNELIHAFYKLGVTITTMTDVELAGRLDSYWTLKDSANVG